VSPNNAAAACSVRPSPRQSTPNVNNTVATKKANQFLNMVPLKEFERSTQLFSACSIPPLLERRGKMEFLLHSSLDFLRWANLSQQRRTKRSGEFGFTKHRQCLSDVFETKFGNNCLCPPRPDGYCRFYRQFPTDRTEQVPPPPEAVVRYFCNGQVCKTHNNDCLVTGREAALISLSCH